MNHFHSIAQKEQKEQKGGEEGSIATIADIAPKNQKVKIMSEAEAMPVEYPVEVKMDSSILGAAVDVLLWPDRAEVQGWNIRLMKSRI